MMLSLKGRKGKRKPTGTLVGHESETTGSRHRVGLDQGGSIGNEQVKISQIDVQVQVMVGHVQTGIHIRARQARRTLEDTREGRVRRRERCFPDVGEFLNKPRVGGLVCLVVHEDDNALAGEDDAGEGGPILAGHGDLGRGEDQVHEAGALDRVDEFPGGNVVRVADHDGHDVVGVGADPLGDADQVVLQRADVEDVAVGVA